MATVVRGGFSSRQWTHSGCASSQRFRRSTPRRPRDPAGPRELRQFGRGSNNATRGLSIRTRGGLRRHALSSSSATSARPSWRSFIAESYASEFGSSRRHLHRDSGKCHRVLLEKADSRHVRDAWCLASWCWTPEQWLAYLISLAIGVGLVGWAYWQAIKWRSIRMAGLPGLV